jgi:plasmid stabilization system protein ParE
LKVTYTEEAVADTVQAITYLNERNPTAAAKLDADITRSIERLADPVVIDLPPPLNGPAVGASHLEQ